MSKQLEAIESRFAIDALIAKYAEAFDTMDETLLATRWHPDSRVLHGETRNAERLEAIMTQPCASMKRMPHMNHWRA